MIATAPEIPRIRKANKAEFAEFFTISLPTVDVWIRRGAPVVQRGRRGVPWIFDLRAVAEWKYGGQTILGELDPDDLAPKDRLDWYKGNREKTRDMEDAGELIPAGDVEARFAELFNNLAQQIEIFPDQAERESGATPAEVAKLQILGDKLRESLHQAATAAP